MRDLLNRTKQLLFYIALAFGVGSAIGWAYAKYCVWLLGEMP